MDTEERQAAIIIANDQDTAIRSAASTLKKAGFAVQPASDAETALTLAGRLQKDAQLALVDENVPGLELAGLVDGLRKHSPDIRILVLSNADSQLVARKGVRILKKPVRRSALLGHVLDLVEQPLVLTA
jgi:DNA-binding response OmpR family regulator